MTVRRKMAPSRRASARVFLTGAFICAIVAAAAIIAVALSGQSGGKAPTASAGWSFFSVSLA